MSPTWNNFCSFYPNSTLPDGGLQIWISQLQDFGPCFHDVYRIVSHSLVLVFAAYSFGMISSRQRVVRSDRRSSFMPKLCRILQLAVALIILLTLVLRYVILLSSGILRAQLNYSTHVSMCVAVITWGFIGLHCAIAVRKSDGSSRTVTGFFVILPVISGFVFELWSSIGGIFVGMPSVYRYSSYVIFSAVVLLLAAVKASVYLESSSSSRPSSDDTDSLIPEGRPEISVAHAYEKAGWISQLCFYWTGKLIKNGPYIRSTEQLFDLPNSVRFAENGEIFRTKLSRDPMTSKAFLLKPLLSIWALPFAVVGLLAFVEVGATYGSLLVLQKLVEYFEDEDKELKEGLLWAGLLALSILAAALINSHFHFLAGKMEVYVFPSDVETFCLFHFPLRTGIDPEVALTRGVDGVLIDSVYRKLFKSYGSDLSSADLSGKVINLISTDCGRISSAGLLFHALWTTPIEIFVGLYLLYLQVGVSFLGGIGVVIVLLIANQVVAMKIAKWEEEKQSVADRRIKILREVLHCMQIIKFHAWEKYFSDKAGKAREEEMRYLRRLNIGAAFISGLWQVLPLGMAVSTFVIYVLLGNRLTAAKVFPSIAIFRMVTPPLMQMSWQIVGMVEMWVSTKRLQQFFALPDLSLEKLYTIYPDAGPLLIVKAAAFSGQSSEELLTSEPTGLIHHISFNARPGEFIGITGKIGSGKSVLLNSIAGEMHKLNGELGISSSLFAEGFGYVPQEPWILQGSVRANILLGDRDVTDPLRYRKVLEVCSLTTDLENMPNDDLTEIGEKGVTLSGGQKARLALARAVYQDKDVILLDDPLAAVDPHVAAAIYDKCILGMLRKKTRIFVTHNVEHLRQCDKVLVMRDGKIVAQGIPDEVLDLPELEEMRRSTYTRQDSVKSAHSVGDEDDEEEGDETAKLVDDEETEAGVVKLDVYLTFFRAVGWPSMIAVAIVAFLNQAGINAGDLWISYSIGQHQDLVNDTAAARSFLIVYGSISAPTAVIGFLWPVILFLALLGASRILHSRLLDTVLAAKMQFFDSTPSGRILNRFSGDISGIDDNVPLFILIVISELFGLIGVVVVVVYSLPWFVLVLLPMAVAYNYIQKYYRHASRELKRLKAITTSPLYSLYGETLHGLPVIRSMRVTEKFCNRFSGLLYANLKLEFALTAAEQWMTLWLEMVGLVMVCGVLVIGFVTQAKSVALGLALAYSVSSVQSLISLIECFIQLEKGMVSVERVKQYVDNVEPERFDGPLMTQPDWPATGNIDIRNLCVRYRLDLPDVLDDITLQIKPGEKVGIVGRTGAGKSTLMLALFRMMEAHSGSMHIDDINISYLNLRHLRSRLTIIPQTPCIFDASIRDNLDPLHSHTDDQIWRTVEICHLRSLVEKLGGDLTAPVGENGKKLSAGEKQLVSLARALLSNSKIICLDEATANIDFETDLLVQQTIRETLASSTILTIAHRVQTVLDCDRIVVMSNGRISEEGSPHDLMQRPDSRFYQMVEQSRNMGESS